jgi:hypothetical protein
MQLRAFHGNEGLKSATLERLLAHQDAGELLDLHPRWRDGKGTSVGCMVHSDSLCDWETTLGIPRSLGALIDELARAHALAGAPGEHPAVSWIRTVPVGADMRRVALAMYEWSLADHIEGLAVKIESPHLRKIVDSLIELARNSAYDKADSEDWKRVRKQAVVAADMLGPESPNARIAERIATIAWSPLTSAAALQVLFSYLGSLRVAPLIQALGWTDADNAAFNSCLRAARERAKDASTPGSPADAGTIMATLCPQLVSRAEQNRALTVAEGKRWATVWHGMLCRWTFG